MKSAGTAEPGSRHLDTMRAHPRAWKAYERLRAVLDGGRPDRVPFFDNYWPQFRERYIAARGLSPDTDLRERFDHDFVLMPPVMGPWPSRAGSLGRDAQGHEVSRDDFGLVSADVADSMSVSRQIDHAIKTPRDLDTMSFEDPAAEVRFAGIERELPKVCRRFCPVFKLGGPFSRSWRLRGLARFLEDLAADEPFARAMVERMTEHLIAVGRAAVERLDIPRVQLHIADDFAATRAPLLSPALYERVFLPNLTRLVGAFHALGFKVSYESEGNTWPMLEHLDAAGIDGLAYMEPRAGMRVERVKERFGDRFFFLGNVCNTQVLPSGDRLRIAADVRRVLGAAVDGRYMGLSAHSIGTDVSPDSYDYFWGLMDRYARYPIKLDGLEGRGMAGKRIRMGVSGLGRVGWPFHCKQIASHDAFELVAVQDPLGSRREEAERMYGCRSYERFEDMLRKEKLDAVAIASPTHLHRGMSEAAFREGCHVMLEKPMAPGSEEAAAIVRAARRRGRTLTVYQPARAAAYFQELRALLSSGAIGEPYHYRIGMYQFTIRNDWQALRRYGGGMLNNYGAHALDQLLQLVGYDVRRVWCNLRLVASLGDAEDVVKVMLETRKGIVGELDINQASTINPYRLMVWGSRGSVSLSPDQESFTVRSFAASAARGRTLVRDLASVDRRYPDGDIHMKESTVSVNAGLAVDVYADFAQAIRKGRPAFVRPEEPLAVMRLIDRCRADAGRIHRTSIFPGRGRRDRAKAK